MNVVEKKWITKSGFSAAVIFVDGSHRCGYVGFDKNHWVHESGYEIFWELGVHGGVTFSGVPESQKDDDIWWLGFDCAHAGDKTRWNKGIKRSLSFCIKECENLAAQIKNLSGTSFEHLVMFKKTNKKLSDNLHNKMIALSLIKDKYAIEYCKMLK